MTKPPVPIADRSIAVPSALPKMTKDLPLYSLSILVVSTAGDVNGDGLDDLIIGAPNTKIDRLYKGKSFVIFGKADGTAIDLPAIGTGGFVINGENSNNYSGHSVLITKPPVPLAIADSSIVVLSFLPNMI
jgi:hypothetical protein